MKKVCKNCKFWNPSCGECICNKFIYSDTNGPDAEGEDILNYWDDEGYYADFCTGPEFGCVHFEENKLLKGE